MKLSIKKLLVNIMIVTMVVSGITILSPTDNPVITEVNAASVKISAKTKTIYKGKSATLKVTGTKKKVTWSSSNKKVATVSSKGKVTAKKAGTATITAKVSGKKYTCKVTVKNPTLSKKTVSLNKGKTTTLKVTGGSSIKWSTSNKKVATVTSKGKVTAVGKGTATITAKTSGVTLKCTVKVTIPVSSVKLSKTTLSLNKGSSSTLTATVSPSNANTKTVTWSSSNTKVAKVSGGKVTAVGAGTATITAKSNNGKTATCKVTVKDPTVAVTSVSLSSTSATIDVGSSKTLTATIKPTNATNKTVTWSSSNTAVATVSSSGTVKGVKAGTATITAKSNNGKTATCTVTVKSPTPSTIDVTSISLDRTTWTTEVGYWTTLNADVSPSNATNKTITWSSSNSNIVSVDSGGKITAKAVGTATITAKSNNGKTATCKVTVKERPNCEVSLDKTSATINITNTITLKPTIKTTATTVVSQEWSSSNPQVATVDNNGKVTGVGTGKATVYFTVVYNNGSYNEYASVTCDVTVENGITTLSFDKSEDTLYEKQTYTLPITITKADGTKGKFSELTAALSDSTVATVDSNGVVTAKKAGTTTLTVTSSDGKKATMTLKVVEFKQKFQYDNFEVLNKYTLYNDSDTLAMNYQEIFFYYETDIKWNTDTDRRVTFEFTDGESHPVTAPFADALFLDIHNVLDETGYPTGDIDIGKNDIVGRYTSFSFKDPGVYTLNIYESYKYDSKNVRIKVGTYTFNIHDYQEAYQQWKDEILDQFYQPEYDPEYVLQQVEKYVKDDSKYVTNLGYDRNIALISHRGAAFETKEFVCQTAANIMYDFCLELNKRYEKDGVNHILVPEMKTITNSLGDPHVVCYVTIDGQPTEAREYYDCNQPYYTNYVDINNIDYIK